jgi:hypothetical protein
MSEKVVGRKKSRAKDLLAEMGKLRAQRDECGSVSLTLIKDWALARKVASSLLADAGLDISNERHVVAFLVLIAAHLHLDFPPGKRSTLPVDNFSLLEMACRLYQVDGIQTFSEICRHLHRAEPLSATKLNTLRTQLGRLIDRAISGSLKVGGDETRIAAMQPILLKIQSTRRGKEATQRAS